MMKKAKWSLNTKTVCGKLSQRTKTGQRRARAYTKTICSTAKDVMRGLMRKARESFTAEAELCGGTVKSAWRTADGGFEYCFTVPKGVTAIVKTGTEESVYSEGAYTINVKV